MLTRNSIIERELNILAIRMSKNSIKIPKRTHQTTNLAPTHPSLELKSDIILQVVRVLELSN